MSSVPENSSSATNQARQPGQAGFSKAVRNPQVVTPKGLIGPDGAPSNKRFSVYRNNVMLSLIDALGANFPAIQRLVGEESFASLAREFIIQCPPEIPMLFLYGDKFAGFLEQFQPLADYPYLADVARVEFAWLQSYHAADREVLDGGKLGEVAAEDIGRVRFITHPASWIFRSKWPAATLVSRNRDGDDCSNIDLAIGEDVLITRPVLNVDMRIIPPGGFEFLGSLEAGATLEDAAGAALAASDGFDLASQISGMLECGVFCAIRAE